LKKQNSRLPFKLLLGLSAICAVVLLAAWYTGNSTWMGLGGTGCFVSLALAATIDKGPLHQLSFTIWIAACTAIGLSYPQWFLTFPPWFFGLGGREMSVVFIPILQIIMFAMGTTLSITDFTRVLKMPSDVIIGTACQFVIMPLLGFLLARYSGLEPEIAAGFVLVGASPGGLASNVMAFIAKANVALSVTLTAVSTLMSPIVTPLLMGLLAGEMVTVDVPKMMWSMANIVLLPVAGGLVFHHLIYHRLKLLERIMPVISMSGIVILVVLTVAVGRDKLLEVGMLLIICCIIHSSFGFGLGYILPWLLGRDETTCRTIAIEVGLQNAGMATGLAKDLGKVATLGLVPIVFGPVMNILGSVLANWWRAYPVENTSTK
jgi:bile acid:Na+ symporter, BASS family